jgi:hypothetical protein
VRRYGWPVVALLLGVGAGIATSYLQGELPGSWNTLANSGAVWTVVAFGIAAAVVFTRGATVVAGLAALLGEVLGYYAVASPIRGIATSTSERALWIAAAVVAGPLVGYAAWLCRRGRPAARLAAGLAMCGVVAGEGVHGVLRISHTSAAAWVEIGLGVAIAMVLLARAVAPWRARVGAAGLGVCTALAVALVYGATVLR